MPPQKYASRRSNNRLTGSHQDHTASQRGLLLRALAVWVLLSLACMGPGSTGQSTPRPVIIVRRWPTLTSTPKPAPDFASDPAEPSTLTPPESTPTNPASDGPLTDAPTSVKFFFIPTFTPVPAIARGPTETGPSTEMAVGSVTSTPAAVAAVNPGVSTPAGEASPPHTAAPTATDLPTPTAVPTEVPAPTPTDIPTPTPLPVDWVFSGMHAYPAEALSGMVLYGNLLNNTGTSQQLNEISTTLYDAGGQAIPYQKAIDQWPVRALPQGGQVPFGVIIPNVQGVVDFSVEVQAEPGGDIPREDFEFVDVNPTQVDGEYCLKGWLQNFGDQLQTYLMVTAVLYDDQDQVINYNNAFQSAPKEVIGDQALELDLCVDPRQQDVARYELRAWGL